MKKLLTKVEEIDEEKQLKAFTQHQKEPKEFRSQQFYSRNHPYKSSENINGRENKKREDIFGKEKQIQNSDVHLLGHRDRNQKRNIRNLRQKVVNFGQIKQICSFTAVERECREEDWGIAKHNYQKSNNKPRKKTKNMRKSKSPLQVLNVVCRTPFESQDKYRSISSRIVVSPKTNKMQTECNELSYYPVFNEIEDQNLFKETQSNNRRLSVLSRPAHTNESEKDSNGCKSNLDESIYKNKYKKYKSKYLELIKVLRELQSLNQIFAEHQNQNYLAYKENVSGMQKHILLKEREITELAKIIEEYQREDQKKVFNRQLEFENADLREKIQVKNQILKKQKSLCKIQADLKSQTELEKEIKRISTKCKSLEKQNSHLSRQNQTLTKKFQNVLKSNEFYEDIFKDKQSRITKLSEFNSELCLEILKLKNKNKIQNDNTLKTEMSQLVMTFAKKQNGYDSGRKNPNINTIESYLASIDEQIHRIKQKFSDSLYTSVRKINLSKNLRKCESQMQLIDEPDRSRGQEISDPENRTKYFFELKNLSDKLAELCENAGTNMLNQHDSSDLNTRY